ncbi:PspC domain-containing protein [Constantimarinum furrinae]|uniref:Responsive transcriptional regulator n=1 Tax=Constantimarinum furrinae TaxID=2562285 RepID=A0A7G8PVR2_9FLAO|nr:PspC domain-containing protein [Constantimarinum furrinae]QNJ98428.1 responsive transcriptional regulator [Constantimarinum furrinae]
MKKTVNINLAGTFFHIDEDAFAKLQRYLDAIKRSLSDPQGSDEILRDIEARIAELFSEKIENSSQVISIKELDAVIAVMGQPEDYMVDEEIFEDTPPTSRSRSHASYKQLFRDIDNKFIAGVSSGLGHYLGIDAIWVRLIWILLTVFSSGIFIVFYILFWILVPAAESTSDKLKMTGEAVNISNIEKKFKEGYEKVADSVKNADYDKYGKKVKSGATGFFEALGNILLTILKIFVKFIGIILIIVSLSTLIGLIIGLFTFGSVDIWGSGEFMDYFSMIDTTNSPLWLISLMTLFAVGIPFFVLFILGLKLLIDNLKSIGTAAKIILLILWVASLIGLGIIGLQQATTRAYDGEFITEETLPVRTGDTLRIAMGSLNDYTYSVHRNDGLRIKYDENDNKQIYSNDVRFAVRSTNDSIGKIILEKKAQGASFLEAKQWAEAIDYKYNLENGTLTLDGFFTTDLANKYRDQEVEIVVYLPLGSILYAESETYSFHRNYSSSGDILDNGDEQHYLLILQNKTQCLDCASSEAKDPLKVDTPTSDWESQLYKDLELETPAEATDPSEGSENTTPAIDSTTINNNN